MVIKFLVECAASMFRVEVSKQNDSISFHIHAQDIWQCARDVSLIYSGAKKLQPFKMLVNTYKTTTQESNRFWLIIRMVNHPFLKNFCHFWAHSYYRKADFNLQHYNGFLCFPSVSMCVPLLLSGAGMSNSCNARME